MNWKMHLKNGVGLALFGVLLSTMACLAPKKGEAAAPVVEKRSQSEVIIDTYLEAIGGRAALEKVEDITMDANLFLQGMTLSFVDQRKAPNRRLAQATMGGNVVFKQVFDGQKGYTNQMGQKQEMADKALVRAQRGLIFPELGYRSGGYKTRLVETVTVNDVETHKIEVEDPDGDKTYSYYRVDTGLKVKTESMRETPAGAVQEVYQISDYREVEGLKLPFKLTVLAGGQSLEFTATGYKINQKLDDAVFAVE